MTRPSPPEAGSVPTAVFTAPSLPEALAAARAAHGPRATILRALRVRQGVRGLLGRERYEVHVVPTAEADPPAAARAEPRAAAAEPRPDREPERPVPGPEDVLRDLVEAADEIEGEPVPSWSWTGASDVSALLEGITGRRGRDVAAGHPAPDLARHVEGVTAPRRERTQAVRPRPGPATEPDTWRARLVDALDGDGSDWAHPTAHPTSGRPASVRPAPAPRPASTWDRATLRGLGVPAAVLRRLPAEDPSDDAGWRLALRDAIAAVVPPPVEPGEHTPVVVSGYGLAGVVAVLRAAVDEGCPPGTIAMAGLRRPATPAALVEVLAACARP